MHTSQHGGIENCSTFTNLLATDTHIMGGMGAKWNGHSAFSTVVEGSNLYGSGLDLQS